MKCAVICNFVNIPGDARQREPAGLVSQNLWHGRCTIQADWDFSAQFENETLPGPLFRARQRLNIGRVGQLLATCLALSAAHAIDDKLSFCATLSFHNSARTREATLGSELPALFQFLRVARRALLSLYSASDQNQSNGSEYNRPNHSQSPYLTRKRMA